MNSPIDNAATVAEAWGVDAPDWIIVLAEACNAKSQGRVAREIGYSTAVVNQVLRGRYKGVMSAVEQRVRANLMAETVACPAAGDRIQLVACLDHQAHAKAKNRTSAFRALMYRACRSCPHSRIGDRHA